MRDKHLEYKCKRCGMTALHNNLGISSEPGSAVDAILGSNYFSRHITHDCEDGGLGVCDFIGISPLEDSATALEKS